MVETQRKSAENPLDLFHRDPSVTEKINWFCDIIASGVLTETQVKIFSLLFKYSYLLNHPVDKRIQEIADELGVHVRNTRRGLSDLCSLRLIWPAKKSNYGNDRIYLILMVDVHSLARNRKILEQEQCSIIRVESFWVPQNNAVSKMWKTIVSHCGFQKFEEGMGVKSTPIMGAESTPIMGAESTPIMGAESTRDRRVTSVEIKGFDAGPDLSPDSFTDFFTEWKEILTQKIKKESIRDEQLQKLVELSRKFSPKIIREGIEAALYGPNPCKGWPKIANWITNHVNWNHQKELKEIQSKRISELQNMISPTIKEVIDTFDEAQNQNVSETPKIGLLHNGVLQNLGINIEREWETYKKDPRPSVLEGIHALIWNKARQVYKV